MRLRKLIALPLMVVILFSTFAFSAPSFAQGKTTSTGDDTPNGKSTCTCKTTVAKKKKKKKTRKYRKARKYRSVQQAPAPSAPKAAAQNNVFEADFTNVTVTAGTEVYSKAVTTPTFEDGTAIVDLSKYLKAQASPNLQAWFTPNGLQIFSPNGGDGRVIVTDNNGRWLDTVIVTSPSAASSMEKNVQAIADNVTKLTNDIGWLWWIVLIGLIIIILLLLLQYFRTGRILNVTTETRDIVDNVDHNVAAALNFFNVPNIRRRIAADSENDDDPDRPKTIL